MRQPNDKLTAMSSKNRSEFSPKTKAALARRANQRCSFTNCRIPTSGPSEVGPDKSLSLGDASHIHAAAPNGPRYLASMTAEERCDITNGIWLCAQHNRLVDNDDVRYSADSLRAMKFAHEASVIAEIEKRFISESQVKKDLVSLGPNIVCIGELLGTDQYAWDMRIDEFLEGNINALIHFIDTFSAADPYNQYVLVNDLGDGRALAGPPSWRKDISGLILEASVKPGAKRIDVHRFLSDLALGPTHDLVLSGGDLALVSGFDAFKQTLSTCLSTQQGEMWFHPNYGVRFGEYAHLYEGSSWLPHFIKMEVIRMASLPYVEPGNIAKTTPLKCVRCVQQVNYVGKQRDDHWHLFYFDLDLEGFGNWKGEVPVYFDVKRPAEDSPPGQHTQPK